MSTLRAIAKIAKAADEARTAVASQEDVVKQEEVRAKIKGKGVGDKADAAEEAQYIDHRAVQQGWDPVPMKFGGDRPGPRVGATLTCLEVALHAKDLRRDDVERAHAAAHEQQYGLFLFGGDDEKGNQTDTLYVYYLQDRRWERPMVRGKQPTKRSRHTATAVSGSQDASSAKSHQQWLLLFGGVGASNAVSVLEPNEMEWTMPPTRAAHRKIKRKKKEKERAVWMPPEDDALLPCARFGHSSVTYGERIIIFGGQDHRAPLGDLYELHVGAWAAAGGQEVPMDWVRPEVAGYAPPPSSMHSAAIMRDHMLLVGGEPAWQGFLWALKLQPPMTWLRTTTRDFPLRGVSRHTLCEFVTPKPHQREEVIIMGGVIEREVITAFFTLDVRSWHAETAELPRETWLDCEERLHAQGLEAHEIQMARSEWEDHMKKEVKKAKKKGKGKPQLGETSKPEGDDDEAEEDEPEEEKPDEEFTLPTEYMDTLTLGEWVPLRLGKEPPDARFGHCMVRCGNIVYMFGGRTLHGAIDKFLQFDGKPLLWRSVPVDGDTPGSRVSHRTLLLDHYLYLLGGGSGNRSFNDLRRLDLYTMHWELVATRGEGPDDKPDAIIGTSLQYVEPYMVVFGGGDGRRPSNDLHTLDMNTMLWRKINTDGAPPAPRVGHTATMLDSSMIVFGGFSKGKYFHDVHMLDVEKLQWSQFIVMGTAPHGRVSHTATLIKGEIHIFGGSAGGACYNDYIVLSHPDHENVVAAEERKRSRGRPAAGGAGGGGGGGGRPAKEAAGGRALSKMSTAVSKVVAFNDVSGASPPPSPPGSPSSSAAHASVLPPGAPPPSPPPAPPGDGAMVPYATPQKGDGGGDAAASTSRTQGSAGGPTARSAGTQRSAGTARRTSASGGGRARRADQQRKGVWRYPEIAGLPPAPRFSHTASVVGDLLFVMGGLARKGRAYGDVHILDLRLMEWSSPRVSLEGPAARGRHTVEVMGSVLFVFGGGAEGRVFDDFWALDTTDFGMVELEQRAAKAGLAPVVANDEPLESALALSFLLPQMGEAPPVVTDAEYDDVEARAADADEVSCWLQHLGLGEHAYAFSAHEIDLEVLIQLEEHDLTDMGVHDPTQRLRLLRGIEVLRTRGSLAAVGKAPGERLFKRRFRLGCEVNFGGSPAILAVDTKTDLKVCVKFIHSTEEYARQLTLHQQLKGEMVARLVEAFPAVAKEEIQLAEEAAGGVALTMVQLGWGLPCLILEYGDSSLGEYVGRGLLPPTERKATFEAMVRVVLALHARGLAHCALQPESFRLYEGTSWRLANLESCTAFHEPSPRKIPVCYAAPEVVRHLRLPKTAHATAALDVWSLGVLLWQLFSQQPLFLNEAEATTLLASHAPLAAPMGCVVDEQAHHLLLKMLVRKPTDRLEPAKVLKHGYLAGGMDTTEMEASFGPMQKGHLFLRSLLQQIKG